MALDSYLQKTQLLLSDPSFEIFNPDDLTTYINMARGQIAGEAECIRVMGSLSVDSTTQQYAFGSITLTGFTASVLGVLNVRQINYNVASGAKALHSRPFPWFNSFVLAQPAPTATFPSVWSQLGQGANGTLYFNTLDVAYTLNLDCVGYPVPLVDDSTAEALPYQWTDAVPFFAAYYAAMTAGNAEAAKMWFDEYSKFVHRARAASTSAVLPGNFAQSGDQFATNRLGLQQGRGQ